MYIISTEDTHATHSTRPKLVVILSPGQLLRCTGGEGQTIIALHSSHPSVILKD